MPMITTTGSAKAWSPDVFQHEAAEVVPDALVLRTSTLSGQVEGDAVSVRVAYVDDAAAQFVPEGEEIPTSDPGAAECLVYTGKVAQIVRLSREQWHQPGTSTQLADSVARAVTRAADTAYLAQPAPTAPQVTPPAGLLNIVGTHDGGTVSGNLDALVDGIAAVGDAGARPTHILASATAWARLRKMKTGTDRNDTLLGAGTQDAEPRLLGIPVLTTPAMPPGRLVVIDQTAIISAVGPVEIATSEHGDFTRDGIMIRCTFRFGANIVRPDRIATFEVDE